MYAKRCNGLLIPFLLTSFSLAADQYSAQAKQTIDIPYMPLAVEIDGDLSDEIWQHAKVIDISNVTSPYDNTPSPIKTEARIIDNGEQLIVSFKAFDPKPENIIGSIGERDTRWGDDVVGIKLDPLNNRRITYSFFVNPYGVQNDETFNELTGEPNELWDGIWQSYGKVTDFGYQVEMAIPYHILNFDQNSNIKQWPFELVRVYPREPKLRITNIKLDRDNACWLCQYPMAQGFSEAKIGRNLQLTPALVATYDEQRDIYNPASKWQDDTDVEASLDIRWGITPQTLLNATINPDFSTVEADAGQLKVNNKFSLFLDEKRSFFLENNSSFESITNLVYTRNIADPDYGAKLTGSHNSHNYGMFISHDTETNFILSGNLSAQVAELKKESHSGAFRYLYDISEDATVGMLSTFRKADDYHNYVTSIDGSYRLDGANLIKVQGLYSDTKYPDQLYNQFCFDNCLTGNEQVLRSRKDDNFTDSAYLVQYIHDSEYWTVNAEREWFGDDFRADLGFINRIDYVEDGIDVARTFYRDDSLWHTVKLGAEYEIHHNEKGEFIDKEQALFLYADGPKLSYIELTYLDANRVGLRDNGNSLAIDGNTKRFNEKQLQFFGQFRPTNKSYLSLEAIVGDKIDYDNNRLGDFI